MILKKIYGEIMDKIEYFEFYKKIYDLLAYTTPLIADCGILCNHRCCNGDEETGMLLFPHEKTTLNVIENEGRRLAVCDGSCKRIERPLSCMLFPFFPVINEKGKIEIELDYRGAGICPLVLNADVTSFNRKFIKNAKKAGKLLIRNEECKAFMLEITEEIKEAKEIALKLNGKD